MALNFRRRASSCSRATPVSIDRTMSRTESEVDELGPAAQRFDQARAGVRHRRSSGQCRQPARRHGEPNPPHRLRAGQKLRAAGSIAPVPGRPRAAQHRRCQEHERGPGERAASSARQNIKWVEQLAIKSPFSSEDIIGAYQIGAALGFTSDNLKILIHDTADWAAASGKSREEMMGVFTALGQMNMSGRANYGKMMSLVVRGVPVWDYLAKAMGKPVGEIQELMSKGLLPANVAIKARLRRACITTSAAQPRRMANSLAGLEGSLHDLAIDHPPQPVPAGAAGHPAVFGQDGRTRSATRTCRTRSRPPARRSARSWSARWSG